MKIYLFLFCFITLIGCGNSPSEKSEKNLKNYFFQPDWFKEPKVYELNSIANGTENNKYIYYEKIDNNHLKQIAYDKDFNQVSIVVFEYLSDKVICTEFITVETWNDNRKVKENVLDSVVFDYHKMNEDIVSGYTYRQKEYSNIEISVTRNLKDFDKQKFNGKEFDVIIANGITKINIKTDSVNRTIVHDERIVYAENIGIIYRESKSHSVEQIEKLNRILNLDEFIKIKNAH